MVPVFLHARSHALKSLQSFPWTLSDIKAPMSWAHLIAKAIRFFAVRVAVKFGLALLETHSHAWPKKSRREGLGGGRGRGTNNVHPRGAHGSGSGSNTHRHKRSAPSKDRCSFFNYKYCHAQIKKEYIILIKPYLMAK